jgi:GT2 family glycosyltransferase
MSAAAARPDVSIIVIAFDVRDEVLACFESVEQHAGDVSVECFLIDNASSDGTADAVAARFPEVETIVLDVNEGLPARNHGLRRARGRHRMFIDSDALLTPGALRTMVDALDEDESLGLVGPRIVYPSGELQLSTRRYPPLLLPILRRPPLDRFFEDGPTIRHHLMAGEAHDRRRRVEYVIGACQLFRAEAQAAAGEIDERIWFGHDDADWCFTIREAGFEVLYAPDAEVIHDYRRTSAQKPLSSFALRQLAAHVHFQRKWWNRRRDLIAQGRAMDAEVESAPALELAGGVPA